MKMKQLGKRSDDHRLSEKRGAMMVVSVLIATLTYQAFLNPPGGFWQDAEPGPAGSNTAAAPSPYMAVLSSPKDKHEAGIAINKNIRGFQCFLIANTVALFASLVIILILTSAITIRRRLIMWMLMIIMWISVFYVACSFLCGDGIILRDPSDQEANYLELFYLWLHGALCPTSVVAHFHWLEGDLPQAVEVDGGALSLNLLTLAEMGRYLHG
ncbi:hypothetical protein EJ110_NYTH22153 [Nymphaea thermarum]|nr:hypothetical protein EJ110_NYTH22153 [Nymphaea thermarum]